MQFPKARRKLNEAKFFFGLMKEHGDKALLRGVSDWDLTVTGYYMSASISAAHSVLDVLKNEDKNQKVYPQARLKWQGSLTPAEKRLKKLAWRLRNAEVHNIGGELQHGSKLMPVEETSLRSHTAPAHLVIGPYSGGQLKVGVLAARLVMVEGNPVNVDLRDFCQGYITLVEKLIDECE